jgi:hypothetical protein
MRAQQAAVVGLQVPQANTGRAARPAVQVPLRGSRRRDEITGPVVLGDLAELATAARPPENSIAVSVVSMPGGVSAQTVGDGERQRPPHTPHPRCPAGLGRLGRSGGLPCPAAAGQIRKTCGVPAYLRVVIKSDRTQASRTMNAETMAQAGTERVN